jgi:hypothetical protein
MEHSMISKFIFPAVLILISADSFSASRIRCPETSDEVPEGKSLEDYESFFSANKIIPKTELSLNYVEQFKNEFEKFPLTLRQELIKAGNKIHIMEGSGVTVDPTWDASNQQTFDGRPWSEVPGGGGSTARGYIKTPTRIVINHLYDHHGSADMFLHEHGHSLDSIQKLQGISTSQVWKDLLSAQEGSTKFIDDICGSYCTNNIDEGFAELFANYHGCEESRAQMEREVPRIAEFFSRFSSTKNLDTIWEDVSPEEVETPKPESRSERVRRRVRSIFGKLIPNDDE